MLNIDLMLSYWSSRLKLTIERDYKFLCGVVKNIYYNSNAKWRRMGQGKDKKSQIVQDYHIIRSHVGFYPISEGEIKELGSNSGGKTINIEKLIYLPPLEFDQTFIPILELHKCNLNDHPNLTYSLSLIRVINGGEGVMGFHIRYEMGHEGENHRFPHAQVKLIAHNVIGADPNAFPKQIPCFPLKAERPVTLFLSLLVSLYGYKKIKSLVDVTGVPDEGEIDFISQF